ncbi:pirin family protein [Shewanella surugensis]|uniref:Pirin family protein n=1 Tax=Shewanella surugensis TaxID=212020 RepID=A0ABT0LCL2_9GAMM|nr:pirin family protein [Shewanella surugensis]MCL1125441.1 pirin family protein [Shewanella surugensis]
MQVLTRDSLPLGGFAGLTEYRLVTDIKLFGGRKIVNRFQGLGLFVYLADACFNPKGETGMHPHREIDVISVMVAGEIKHEGSLAHGTGLKVGDVQVQRAGGEGFSHNEVNPNRTKNRMIQLWVLPENTGEPAGYKYYSPDSMGVTRIYGGNKQQNSIFDSHTCIDIVRLAANSDMQFENETLIYVTQGKVDFIEGDSIISAEDGYLIRSKNVKINVINDVEFIVVS